MRVRRALLAMRSKVGYGQHCDCLRRHCEQIFIQFNKGYLAAGDPLTANWIWTYSLFRATFSSLGQLPPSS